MRKNWTRVAVAAVVAALVWHSVPLGADSAWAVGFGDGNGWDGKRPISYQHQKDLFYNYYAQPGPHCGAAASMYPAPLPVPPNVGHTYVTYQPFMPHEFLYAHHRSYYTYNPGAGWRRTNVHYGTRGLYWDNWIAQILPMRTNQSWAVHNDLHHPGLRW